MQSIDALENDFLAGKLEALKHRVCPVCGAQGALKYAVAKTSFEPAAEPGRRYQAGISIYCLGNCNSMIAHLDGFCPAWAEAVDDWEQFSAALYPEVAEVR